MILPYLHYLCRVALIQQYNPFDLLTMERVQQLMLMGEPVLVVQRFQWAGLVAGTGFMATRYRYERDAAEHLDRLLPNEGKLVDLLQPGNFLKLLAPGSGYLVFINSLRDKDWAKKMRQVYAEDVRKYIRSQTQLKVDRGAGIHIDFNIRFGRVLAAINTGTQLLEVPFYDIIK
jgi:hypothetical protein